MLVASRGREPGLELWTEQGALPLTDWAAEILDQMQGICELLDAGEASKPYSAALAFQRAKLADFDRAAVGAPARGDAAARQRSFFEVALWMSRDAPRLFPRALPAESGAARGAARRGRASLEEQRAVEARDAMPFAEFVARYTAGSLV